MTPRQSLLLPALLVAGLSAARAESGSLVVQVLEARSREPLAGATVTLSNELGLVPRTAALTDAAGLVEFPALAAGAGYVLEASFPGRKAMRVGDVRVPSSGAEHLVLELTEQVEERVRVTAEKPVIDLDRAGTGTRFSDEFIESLPVLERFYQNLLKLAPGVNDADGDGNPNVHGARGRDFAATVGGVSNVDPLTGRWLSYVNMESIEEMELITSGGGVQYGRAQGGFANIVQKQGSNDFEGVASILFRSSKLDGTGGSDSLTVSKPGFKSFQPALQISGPVVKDKVWYRLSHEYISREDPVDVLSSVEVRTRTQTIASDQLTWQISPRNKLALLFQYDPQEVDNVDLSSTIPPESTRTDRRGGSTYGLNWTAPYSERLIVDSRVSYQNAYFDVVPTDENSLQNCMTFERYPVLNTTRCVNLNTRVTSGSFPINSHDRRQRLAVQSDATWYAGRWLGSNHRLKFGFSVENERYFRDLERISDMQFERQRAPIGADYNVLGVAEITLPIPRDTAGRSTGTSWAVYLEDQLKPAANLVLTLGLRVDREEIRSVGHEPIDPVAEAAAFHAARAIGVPTYIAREAEFTAFEDHSGFLGLMAETLEVDPNWVVSTDAGFARKFRRADDINIQNLNVSPRLAFAWDPWSNGKTKVSLSRGRYYGRVFLAVPLVELEPLLVTFWTYVESIEISDGPMPYIDFLPPVSPAGRAHVVDRNLKTPYQDEFSAGFERVLWPETSVKLTYLRRHFRDQLQDVDINHVGREVINPFWGQMFVVGNSNTAEYKAYVLELVRRMYRNWQLDGSYVWSKAVGDAEDFDQLLGDDPDQQSFERSYLAYDQRHVVKVNTAAMMPWGMRLGASVRWESGLPYSVLRKVIQEYTTPAAYGISAAAPQNIIYLYPTGLRNDQRNESSWTVDLRAAQTIVVKRGKPLELSVEIFNLLDDDTLVQRDRIDEIFDGVRRFGRQYQLGVRYSF